MRYAIKNNETGKIVFGQWDSENLYFLADDHLKISSSNYDKHWTPLKSDYIEFSDKPMGKTIVAKSMNKKQLEEAILEANSLVIHHEKNQKHYQKKMEKYISYLIKYT